VIFEMPDLPASRLPQNVFTSDPRAETIPMPVTTILSLVILKSLNLKSLAVNVDG
jgi:hypothetical protein